MQPVKTQWHQVASEGRVRSWAKRCARRSCQKTSQSMILHHKAKPREYSALPQVILQTLGKIKNRATDDTQCNQMLCDYASSSKNFNKLKVQTNWPFHLLSTFPVSGREGFIKELKGLIVV